MRDEQCATCAATGRAGYCARNRCYCGHQACWGFDSWRDIKAVPVAGDDGGRAARRMRELWADKSDNSWIDTL